MTKLPVHFERFLKEYPEIAAAYERLGDAVHNYGALNDKERAIVKLSLAAGAKLEGVVHSQVRKAIKTGLSKKEIRQVALLAIPTIGFPHAMAVLSWMDDILDKKKGR